MKHFLFSNVKKKKKKKKTNRNVFFTKIRSKWMATEGKRYRKNMFLIDRISLSLGHAQGGSCGCVDNVAIIHR